MPYFPIFHFPQTTWLTFSLSLSTHLLCLQRRQQRNTRHQTLLQRSLETLKAFKLTTQLLFHPTVATSPVPVAFILSQGAFAPTLWQPMLFPRLPPKLSTKITWIAMMLMRSRAVRQVFSGLRAKSAEMSGGSARPALWSSPSIRTPSASARPRYQPSMRNLSHSLWLPRREAASVQPGVRRQWRNEVGTVL